MHTWALLSKVSWSDTFDPGVTRLFIDYLHFNRPLQRQLHLVLLTVQVVKPRNILKSISEKLYFAAGRMARPLPLVAAFKFPSWPFLFISIHTNTAIYRIPLDV